MKRLAWLFAALFCWGVHAEPVSSPPFASEAEARAAGAVRLSAEELRGLYLGGVVVGRHADGSGFRTPVAADGSIAANQRRGAGRAEVMDDGRVCMRFADLWDGKARCWTHYRYADRYIDFNEDGSAGAELRFERPAR